MLVSAPNRRGANRPGGRKRRTKPRARSLERRLCRPSQQNYCLDSGLSYNLLSNEHNKFAQYLYSIQDNNQDDQDDLEEDLLRMDRGDKRMPQMKVKRLARASSCWCTLVCLVLAALVALDHEQAEAATAGAPTNTTGDSTSATIWTPHLTNGKLQRQLSALMESGAGGGGVADAKNQSTQYTPTKLTQKSIKEEQSAAIGATSGAGLSAYAKYTEPPRRNEQHRYRHSALAAIGAANHRANDQRPIESFSSQSSQLMPRTSSELMVAPSQSSADQLDSMVASASKKKKKMMKKKKKMEKKHKEWKKGKKHKKKKYESKKKKGGMMKKKKGKKEKKKWGEEKKGHKKKGNFKKKKWGHKKKMKKGHKKGKKGHKMLKDKGHKKKGFKKVYHKEEWGKKKKWHDIKREKKWNTKQKKWKKKWHQEKGKKYKGKHMKKYHKKNKHGKKYKKEKKEKYKKHKGEKFKKGHKKKKEEYSKKKEGGKKKKMKKEMKKMKKKKG